MLVTDEKATSLWCPMYRKPDVPFPKCFAQECMFWRWECPVDTRVADPFLAEPNPRGYCGAAGKPVGLKPEGDDLL